MDLDPKKLKVNPDCPTPFGYIPPMRNIYTAEIEKYRALLMLERLKLLQADVQHIKNNLPEKFRSRELEDIMISIRETIKFIQDELNEDDQVQTAAPKGTIEIPRVEPETDTSI